MQLTFRGKTYIASNPVAEAKATQETATFLGKPYALKQYNVTNCQSSSEELTYRGIRYCL